MVGLGLGLGVGLGGSMGRITAAQVPGLNITGQGQGGGVQHPLKQGMPPQGMGALKPQQIPVAALKPLAPPQLQAPRQPGMSTLPVPKPLKTTGFSSGPTLQPMHPNTAMGAANSSMPLHVQPATPPVGRPMDGIPGTHLGIPGPKEVEAETARRKSKFSSGPIEEAPNLPSLTLTRALTLNLTVTLTLITGP